MDALARRTATVGGGSQTLTIRGLAETGALLAEDVLRCHELYPDGNSFDMMKGMISEKKLRAGDGNHPLWTMPVVCISVVLSKEKSETPPEALKSKVIILPCFRCTTQDGGCSLATSLIRIHSTLPARAKIVYKDTKLIGPFRPRTARRNPPN